MNSTGNVKSDSPSSTTSVSINSTTLTTPSEPTTTPTLTNATTLTTSTTSTTPSVPTNPTTSTTPSTTSAAAQALSAGSIAAIVLGIVLGITLIALIALLISRHRNRPRRTKQLSSHPLGQDYSPPPRAFPYLFPDQPPPTESPANVKDLFPHPSVIAREVPLNQFKRHLDSLKANSGRTFSIQFQELQAESEMTHGSKTSEAGDDETARGKNRYKNIKAYDHSRVTLSPTRSNQLCDYINANFIHGFHSRKEYIACQGPLDSTVNDHWQMVFEQNVATIVMLTRCVERSAGRDREKCAVYWPALSETATYGDVQVTTCDSITGCLSEIDQAAPHYVIREMQVTVGECTRTVTQYHCLVWDDFGSLNETALIEFVRIIRSSMSATRSPIVIHCSAGIGRTGTFIALDMLLQQIEAAPSDDARISIFNVIKDLRESRCLMVNAEAQYILLHNCVLDAIRQKMKGKASFYVNAYGMEAD